MTSKSLTIGVMCAVAWVVAFGGQEARGQPAAVAAGQAPVVGGQAADEEMVQLTLGDDIEMKLVIDLVSDRLGVNILYDEQILNKKLTIKAPAGIPAKSLLGLLQSALRMKGLMLIDADVPGWQRVVPTDKLAPVAEMLGIGKGLEGLGGGMAVTQVFLLKNADPVQVDLAIKPFLTEKGANSLALKELQTLIVTDYASSLVKIARIIEIIDQPQAEVVLEFLPVRFAQAEGLAQEISKIIAARTSARSGSTNPTSARPAASTSEVTHDTRSNQIIVVGTRERIKEVKQLLRALDVALDAETKVYTLRHVTAERVDKLLQELLNTEEGVSRYKSAVDEDGNLLFVTGPTEIHAEVSKIKEMLDVTTSQPASPIRFYKLQNATARDLLETLRSLEGDSGYNQGFPGGRQQTRGVRGVNDMYGTPGGPYTPRTPNSPRTPFTPRTPYSPGNTFSSGSNRLTSYQADNFPASQFQGQQMLEQQSMVQPLGDQGQFGIPQGLWLAGGTQNRSPLGQARITADESSNTLIIVAAEDVQRAYADLIKALDRRRPQVLIEAKLVILDSRDDFKFGVEFSAGDRQGAKRWFSLTSYGLSQVDPVTGALRIIPGTGFNSTVVDPSVADAVLQAVTNHRRSRVLSAPRVLVNDNAVGLLTSVQEEPFASVNASNVVATTSFAGYAEAGTTIAVTPHIGEQDHLQLEYKVTLNSFTDQAGNEGIPPPRQTNELESVITIPDGYTVIVGGLRLQTKSNVVDSIPFIEKVPILKLLTSLETQQKRETSLFVFLRPVIMRDDKFAELKYLSDRDLNRTQLQGNFPPSQPMLIRSPAWEGYPQPQSSMVIEEPLEPSLVFEEPVGPSLVIEEPVGP